MAGGGKETPRQKMVGMMYIVLTALMAMNVSSSILEKFAMLSNSIELSANSKLDDTEKLFEHIKSLSKEMGNRPADVAIVNKAIELKNATSEVKKFIEYLKNTLIEKTGGINEVTGYPKNLKTDAEVATLMLKENKAEELKKILNDYMDLLSKITGENYKHIALDADDIDLFKNDPNQAGKNFGDLNFDHTPLGAAIATLNLFYSEVITAEYNAMSKLSKLMGADDIKFDKLNVVVKPKSSYVPAGTKYEAEMFLSASSSAVSPDMFVGGKSISVKDGVGIVSFPVTSTSYDKEGMSKQTYKATIKIKANGKETVTNTDVEYFVVKPVVQVQSASVQALYLNCGNELNIQVPALGVYYNPKFVAEGGTIISGSKKGLITIIPKAKEVKIAVYNDGTFIESLTYSVRAIPKPELKITSNGVVVNEKDGMDLSSLRSLEAKVIADEGFKTFLPNDARYRVIEWDVLLARGSKAIETKNVKDAEKVSIAAMMEKARPGDRIVVEIKKVVRTNFNNVDEPVEIQNKFKIISLIDKK